MEKADMEMHVRVEVLSLLALLVHKFEDDNLPPKKKKDSRKNADMKVSSCEHVLTYTHIHTHTHTHTHYTQPRSATENVKVSAT
jgi:hypothetical protein